MWILIECAEAGLVMSGPIKFCLSEPVPTERSKTLRKFGKIFQNPLGNSVS
jgi:hypothetical protein